MKRFLALTVLLSSYTAMAEPQVVLDKPYKLEDRYCMDGSDTLIQPFDDPKLSRMEFRSDGKLVLSHPFTATQFLKYKIKDSTLSFQRITAQTESTFSISTENDRLVLVSELNSDPKMANRLCVNGGPLISVFKVEP